RRALCASVVGRATQPGRTTGRGRSLRGLKLEARSFRAVPPPHAGMVCESLTGHRRAALQTFKPRVRVPKPVEMHAHAVHEREVQAADFPVLIAALKVVE